MKKLFYLYYLLYLLLNDYVFRSLNLRIKDDVLLLRRLFLKMDCSFLGRKEIFL